MSYYQSAFDGVMRDVGVQWAGSQKRGTPATGKWVLLTPWQVRSRRSLAMQSYTQYNINPNVVANF